MSVRCGGRCGRAGCTYEGATESHVFGHIGSVKSRLKSPPSGPMKSSPPPPGSSEARPFYAPLKELPPGFGKPEDKSGKAAPAAPAPTGPLFDSTPWWLSLGELIDSTLLADKKVKVRMTEEKAKRLDASLQAAGWTVTANPHPVSMPFWAPIAITVVGAFILPLVIGYLPDLIKKARDRAKEATAARSGTKPAPPPTSGLVHVPVPKEAPLSAEEDEEIRMTAAPPPIRWAPMPWHEPGSHPEG